MTASVILDTINQNAFGFLKTTSLSETYKCLHCGLEQRGTEARYWYWLHWEGVSGRFGPLCSHDCANLYVNYAPGQDEVINLIWNSPHHDAGYAILIPFKWQKELDAAGKYMPRFVNDTLELTEV